MEGACYNPIVAQMSIITIMEGWECGMSDMCECLRHDNQPVTTYCFQDSNEQCLFFMD